MNDFKHLFGGMCGAVALLALYILAWGVIQRCHGATIKRVAPDGVNEITTEVDENGYVHSESVTCAYVPDRYIPQSGERVIIGDFEYIMVSVSDWTRLNNADGTEAAGAPYTVTWYTSGGSYYAAINCGSNASGFFKAETSVAGDVVFETNMKLRIGGGIECLNTSSGVMGVIKPTYNGSAVTWSWSAR